MRQGCLAIVLILMSVNEAHAGRNDAIAVSLNQRGLDLLANEVSEQSLAPISDQPIDDQETKVSGIEINVEGATFSARFSDVSLTAQQDDLHASLSIEDVNLNIDRIKLKKKILGGSVRSTCKDTTVKLAHRGGERLDAIVSLSVRQGQMVARVNDVDFSIDDDNYEIHGPRSCTGDLGAGYIVRAAVRLVLDNARGKIEDAIKRQVASMSDDIEAKLDGMTHQNFALDLSKNPLLQGKALTLTSYPSGLSIAPGEIILTLGVSMSDAKGVDASPKAWMAADDASAVGRIGFNPSVISDAAEQLIAQQRGLIWLDETRAPGLRDILTQSTAASIWPDLQHRTLDNPSLRLGIRLLKAPVFKLNASDNTLGLSLPAVAMEFYVTENGAQVLYFTMHVALESSLKSNLNGRTVQVGLAQAPRVSIEGQWGSGIAPDPALFESDVAAVLLSSIFDYLYGSGAVATYTLPPLSLGGSALQPSGILIDETYVQLGLAAL